MDNYPSIVANFARDGARIINIDPRKHYAHIGALETPSRPMEPGFIPIDAPAKVFTVSYYPNVSELTTGEFENARDSFEQWRRTGDVEDYRKAYTDWISFLPDVPFYRDFNAPIFERIGIAATEYAWLPLVKLPLPARSSPHEDDIMTDRILLWDQLMLLKPRVVLAQGVVPYDIVSAMCEGKGFPEHIVLQKIGRVGTNAFHKAEDDRVVREISDALA